MIVVTGCIEWRLLILTLVCSILLILMQRILHNINKEETMFQRSETELTEFTRSIYRCLPLFHIYKGCTRFIKLVLHKNIEIRQIGRRKNRWAAILNFFMVLINMIREFGILVYGTVILKIPLGQAVILTNYTSYINNMFTNLMESYIEYNKANIAAGHIHKIFSMAKEKDMLPGDIHSKQTVNLNREYLQINQLAYSYGKNQVLYNINIKLKKGELLGIEGPVGSGKSTLAKILAGIYPVQTGEIYFDGIQQDPGSLRDITAYVDQKAYLFNGTIRENICCFKSYDEESVKQAVKASGLELFVKSFPEGLDSVLDQNSRMLSGGEQQRVAVARALVKNSPIMVFDEATSALDNETQKHLLNTVYQLKREKTVIMVSHRLKTLEGANQVIRIDRGKIVGVSVCKRGT